MGMLGATRPSRKGTDRDGRRRKAPPAASDAVRPSPAPSVLLFRGCIMDGLFAHVHDATIRTLAVNGYEVREVDRKSTRLNSSHSQISYAVFCLKKKKTSSR